MIAKLQTGSMAITLADLAAMAALAAPYAKDAVEIAKGASAVLSLGKSLRDFLKGNPSVPPTAAPNDFARSGEKMIQTAAKYGSGMELKVIAADGSSLECKLEPGEVTRAELIQRALRDGRRIQSARAPRRSMGSQGFHNEQWLEETALRIASASHDDARDLIIQLTDVLGRIGLLGAADFLQQRLRETGRSELADLLLEEVIGRAR